MTLKQLTKKLIEIKSLGFVKTVRAHQGGVGNTLEYLLGIKENNLRLPDLGDLEIKAKRSLKKIIRKNYDFIYSLNLV